MDSLSASTQLMVADRRHGTAARGSGKAGILWHNTNGQISIWESTGSGFSSVYTGSAGTNWAPFAMHYDIV